LESKIIIMADRLKDGSDTMLESLFRSEPVRDDGFSLRVVSRVRREMWVRRLSLPIAFLIGTVISAKPLLQLASALPQLLASVQMGGLSMDRFLISNISHAPTIIMGVLLLATVLMAGRMLEE